MNFILAALVFAKLHNSQIKILSWNIESCIFSDKTSMLKLKEKKQYILILNKKIIFLINANFLNNM